MEVVTHKSEHNLFSYKEKHLKKQIILCHTSRPLQYYVNSLIYRLSGKFRKIPTFMISREGELIQNFDATYCSDFIGYEEIDKISVIISLENLGWLRHNTLNNKYINWIGDIYKGEVYQKRWRDKSYWSGYTDRQLKLCAQLIIKLCEELNIPLKVLGHNVHVEGIEKFSGIVTRSNYNELWTDLSPSFNFEKLKKYIDEEKNI